MNDLEVQIREALRRRDSDAPAFDPSDARRVASRTRRRQTLNVTALGVGALVLVLTLVAGLGGLVRADRGPTVMDQPSRVPTQSPSIWSAPLEPGNAVVAGSSGDDPHDTQVDWVDVTHVQFRAAGGAPGWYLDLAAKPPLASSLEPGLLINYGVVLDTSGDAVADYLIGINNDAPDRGDFRVWVTDLATGKTEKAVGPPYGLPIDFFHPDEGDLPGRPSTVRFFFLPGAESTPQDLDPATVRWYAWASVTKNGVTTAWDTAPDTGWIGPSVIATP